MKIISGIILVLFATTFTFLFFQEITPSTSSQPKPLDTDITVIKAPKPTPKPLTVRDKKKRFVDTTLPAILRVKNRLDSQHELLQRLLNKPSMTDAERALIESLKTSYGVNGLPCLLNRLQTHPVSIVLAQAALETGWGTSRFYNEANNIFGIWSYNPNEPRIAAGETRGERTIYVKKYPTLDDSIEGYFKMMASGYAYSEFRKVRKQESNPFLLLPYLTRYSELREEYVKRLYYVIKSNRFYTYDDPSFTPLPLAQILPEPEPEIPEEVTLESNTTDPIVDQNGTESIDCNASKEVEHTTIISSDTTPLETNTTVTINPTGSPPPH